MDERDACGVSYKSRLTDELCIHKCSRVGRLMYYKIATNAETWPWLASGGQLGGKACYDAQLLTTSISEEAA